MEQPRLIPLDRAEPGQRLAKEVTHGFTVLLTAGTILTQERIESLRAHGIEHVLILPEGEAVPGLEPVLEPDASTEEPTSDYEVTEPIGAVSEQELGGAIEQLEREGNGLVLPEVTRKLADLPSLHSHAHAYTRSLDERAPLPRQVPSEEEALFARHKESVREEAGLHPALPRAFVATVVKRLSRTLRATVSEEPVSRSELEEMALLLLHNANLSAESFLYLDDISSPGEYVPTHILRTIIAFFKVNGENGLGEDRRREFAKGIIGHNLGLAKLALSLLQDGEPTEAIRTKLHDSYRNLYHNLRRTNGIDESVLEMVFLQNEHYDGSGFPYRLSGDSIPRESQTLSLASRFSHLTLSKPRLQRLTPRGAMVRVLANSGRVFHPRAVLNFIQQTGVYPVGSPIRTGDNRIGLVVKQNKGAVLHPVVCMVEADAEGRLGLGSPCDLKQTRTPIAEPLREF